jgi:tetratricopeptide (TPR) repeat protein
MFTTVERRRSNRSGGGASSPLVPKIYDMVTPDSLDQAALLADWNGETLERALVYPVEITMKGTGQNLASQDLGEAVSLGARIEADAEKSRAEAAAAWAAMDEGAPLFMRAEAAFRAAAHDHAERLFNEMLTAEPDNPKALAYMGSLIALKASSAPVLAAVDLVTQAYRYLDRAADLAATEEEKLAAFMNRGNVSLSVPNTVFNKALAGAEDFLKAAEIYRSQGNTASAAAAYYNAYRCFTAAGKDEEGGTWLREAQRLYTSQ